MATIQGLTAPRMLEIEAAAIVAGVVDENLNLILTKHDGSTINAGKVQGDGVPTGGTEGQIIVKTLTGSQWVNNFATNVEQTIKNNTGATLTKGTAVFVSGATGDNILVTKAQANSEATSSKTLGLLGADIANGAVGGVITEGTLYGFDTSAATVGDAVWLSPTTAGGLVYGAANKPTVPNHMVYMGVVVRAHATNGAIYVKVQNGYELDELHDVKITNPQPKQVIKRDPTNQFWLNEAASGGVVVSGTNPVDPSVGDGWFYDANGDLFVRYFDGTNYAWMQPSVPMSPTIEQRYYSPNYVINGGFDIWQRGTAAVNGIANTAFHPDRWFAITDGVGNVNSSRVDISAQGIGSQYAWRLERTSGTNRWVAIQMAEGALGLVGQNVTLSFYLRKGSALTSGISYDISTRTAKFGTTYDRQAATISNSSISSSTFTRFSVTMPITSATSGAGADFFEIEFSASQAGASNAFFELAGVQLELGSTATPFRRNANSLQGELAACQRYYTTSYPYGVVAGTSTTAGSVNGDGIYEVRTGSYLMAQALFHVPMRVAPSVILYSPGSGSVNNVVRDRIGVASTDSSSVNVNDVSNKSAQVYSSSGIDACRIIFHYTASAEL